MIRNFVKWLFSAPTEPQPWWKVITWWEIRRIPCNLILGCVGFVSLMLFFLFISLSKELIPGEDAVEPMALFMAPILFNIAYTGGWVAELFLRIVWKERTPVLGSVFLKLGMSFSLFVAILPSAIWFLIWIKRSIIG